VAGRSVRCIVLLAVKERTGPVEQSALAQIVKLNDLHTIKGGLGKLVYNCTKDLIGP
jgi:hypothetical protein